MTDSGLLIKFAGMIFDEQFECMAHDEEEAKRIITDMIIEQIKSGEFNIVVWKEQAQRMDGEP